MTELAVHGVHKAYGKVRALAGVDITVASGSLVTVLGPSGCGKTTLLRCVAGFERLDGGTIRLGDRVVAADRVHVPPHRRGVAVVPQEGALFPHLSVAGNVGYGLDRAQRRGSRIDEVLELVGLAGYGQRMPHQLSGGQQQRVAVARALAPRPRLVLLDEPFSALDAGLRAELRADIRTALTADKATALLVTHDQDEALSVADEVVVLREGAVVQQASPADLYRAPADTWVARFVGDAVLLPASAEGGTAQTALGRLELAEPATGSVTVLIRPEQVRVLAAATTPGTISATVRRHHFHGHDAMLDLLLEDGTPISARVLNSSLPCDPGTRVGLSVEGPARAFAATPSS